jgi:hypothetical protein
MKKWVAILAIAGSVWMILVLYRGSLFLATVTNYPGIFATRWIRYRGIAPSSAMVWSFNIWLVLTSALEWIAVGLSLRAIRRRLFH